MWPGYGENSRVLKWVFERLNGTAEADKTAIGYLPNATSLDTTGMQINEADLQAITSVDVDGWREAVPQIRDHYAAFGDRLPSELATALDALESSLIKLPTKSDDKTRIGGLEACAILGDDVAKRACQLSMKVFKWFSF